MGMHQYLGWWTELWADGMPGLALTDHGAMFRDKRLYQLHWQSKKGIQKELKNLKVQLPHCSKPTA